MFGPKMHVYEAPLALGALMGGVWGSGIAGGAGILGGGLLGAAAGAALGGVTATLLGKALKPPKMPKSQQSQEQAAARETPALPPATQMPATPMTPVAAPSPAGIPAPSEAISPDIPKTDRPVTPADASPPTEQEIAKGQLEKKRKGRLSTILTTPRSRLEEGEEAEGFERLGG